MDLLESNPMYLALKGKYRKQYETAQGIGGCFFLIPKNESLENVEVTEDFLNAHIVKPSPYFKGEYVTMFGKDTRTVEIDNYSIKRLSGFPDGLPIVTYGGVETGYNKDGKPFFTLILEQPLCDFKKAIARSNRDLELEVTELDIPSGWRDGSSTPTLADCRRILKPLHRGDTLEFLDKHVEAIMKNYLFLPDHIEETSKKILSIVGGLVKELMLREKWGSSTLVMLLPIIECFVMSGLHNRVFPIICQRFESEDLALTTKLTELNQMEITAAQLGAEEIFSCPIPATVVELARLDSLMCPAEKIHCLDNTINIAVAEVKQHMLETQGLLTPPGSLPCVTADELIPILLTAIIRAKLYHLASNVYYMEHLSWHSHGTGTGLMYCLVTFKAAVEFLKSVDVSKICPAKDQLKKELSLEELMEATEKIDSKKVQADTDDLAQWTPVDLQMERITRMIEASTLELSSVQHLGVQSTSKQS